MAYINELYQDFLDTGGTPEATAFGVWLIKNQPDLLAPQQLKQENTPHFIPTDSMLGILIGRLERFIHVESKQAFKKAGITNPDEFALMATLFFMGKTTKSLLLRQCLFEMTTGSQMIKRLKENGYLLEKDNPEDGRSSLIELSESGLNRLFEAFEKLNAIKGLTEGLLPTEKQELLQILYKLDCSHSKRMNIQTINEVIQNSNS